MATARRHWFRVADSVAREDWSNDVAATFLRLGGMLNTRWARDGLDPAEACEIVLRPADLMACTGSQSLARARRIVNELAAHLSITVDEQGANTRLAWPKWAEFQKLDAPKTSAKRPESAPKMPPPPPPPPPPPQDAPAPAIQKGEAPEPIASAPPPPPPASVRRSTKVPKPSSFTGEARDRIQQWAAAKGFDRAALNAGLERFREWEPLKTQNRTISQWVGAFMRIVREGVEEGKIHSKGPGSRPAMYRSADQVLAEARRKQAEDDARSRAREPEEPDQIAKVIDLALRQAAGGGGS